MGGTASAQEKLNAVVQGAREILDQKSFTEAARGIFEQCKKMTGAVSGYVALLSEDGHENEVLFLEAGGLPCSVDPDLPMPIRGLRATAYETQKAVYENDFMSSEWIEYIPDGHVVLKNVLFAPLNVEGKTVGIMGLANKPGDFSDEDAEIASVFGELAAISLSVSRYLDLANEKAVSLERALTEVRTLQSILPMCSRCRKVRDDEGLWSRLEAYLSTHTDTRFSHGLCPECLHELYPDDAEEIIKTLAVDEET